MRRTLASFLLAAIAFTAPSVHANPDGDENAKVVLQLVDLSRPMTARSVISEMVFLDPKPVAWPYQLQYHAQAIDPKSLYGIFAKVVVGSEVLFATQQAAPVITQGNPSKRDLLLEPVQRRAASQ
jgi:uncharacterized lipoprotein YbaY